MKQYDYLIAGAGLFGAVFAHEMKKMGKRCLVIEKRNHTGGNVYCRNVDGINVHQYGAHIFHTNDTRIWEYVSSLVTFNNFINSPLAIYKGRVYNLPFNMNTFSQLWGVITPQEARLKIEEQAAEYRDIQPANLEEQALFMVGKDVYNTFIKGYTEKQWGRKANELPASIIKRIPVRFNYDNNYFNSRYQGIPVGGYNQLTDRLLEGIEVRRGVNYNDDKPFFDSCAHRIVYTGKIDEFYDFSMGRLQYRSLRFEHEQIPIANYQGNAVVNYTEKEIPYTRIIEHKHFEFGKQDTTVITREYPCEGNAVNEPYYPVNDAANNKLFKRYREMSAANTHVIFGGRLAEYQYYDMDQTIASALSKVRHELKEPHLIKRQL